LLKLIYINIDYLLWLILIHVIFFVKVLRDFFNFIITKEFSIYAK